MPWIAGQPAAWGEGVRLFSFHYTLLLLLITTPATVLAKNWGSESLEAVIGSPLATGAGLTVRPDKQAQVLVRLPAAGQSLDQNYRVRVRFAGATPSAVFVLWRNNREDKLHQHGVRPDTATSASVDMREQAGWEGEAVSLELGFLVPTRQPITVLGASLDRPGIGEKVNAIWTNWAAFRGWTPLDINVHTGTRDFYQGPYPVPVFCGVAAALVCLYLLIRRRQSRIQEAALVLLCTWIVLDALWQWRLWRQLSETRAQYGGLTPGEKLLASEDAAFVQLGQRVRETVPATATRLFLASSVDAWGMLAAYHASPLNLYWHRHGPELPGAEYLRPGDHILLLRTSSISYQANQGLIRLENGDEVRVRERLSERAGVLLEVL